MTIKIKTIIKQYLLFLTGLFIASMGVAFSTIAGLGTSPVASLPYSVSLVSSLFSFGGWLNMLSVIQITVQVILLRKKCKPLEIVIQTVLAFVYGYLTNFSCWLIKDVSVENYFEQLMYMFIGCFVLAFGIWLQLKGKVTLFKNRVLIDCYHSIKSLFLKHKAERYKCLSYLPAFGCRNRYCYSLDIVFILW